MISNSNLVINAICEIVDSLYDMTDESKSIFDITSSNAVNKAEHK